jgi:hypothetical protein
MSLPLCLIIKSENFAANFSIKNAFVSKLKLILANIISLNNIHHDGAFLIQTEIYLYLLWEKNICTFTEND